MSAITVLLIAPALAGTVDRVPQDFPTIQQAVTEGQAPVIEVAAGHWAGARIDRPVSLIGAPGATIDAGVEVRPKVRAAFALTGGADDTEIRGFTMACSSKQLDLGVFASVPRLDGAADRVVVSGNTFRGCVQGVTNQGSAVAECTQPIDGGSHWVIEDNTFAGFDTRTDAGARGGGIGIALFNVQAADVLNNQFTGRVRDVRGFSTAGVSLAGCQDCTIAANDFRVRGGTHHWTAVSNRGFYQAGGAASSGLILSDNDASGDSAPNHGVSFHSYDSFDTEIVANRGVTFVDHSHCGDGVIDIVE